MPLKDYNQKIHHDQGIPLEDDYFLEEPEIVLLDDKKLVSESTLQGIAHRVAKKKKRIMIGCITNF